MAKNPNNTQLTVEDCKVISNVLSEYFDGFLIVGYDLADQGRYIVNTKSVKDFRAVMGLGKDVIITLENGDG